MSGSLFFDIYFILGHRECFAWHAVLYGANLDGWIFFFLFSFLIYGPFDSVCKWGKYMIGVEKSLQDF